MELWAVTLLGGVLALDATSVGQFMVSRPLVAGALAGWLLGDPALGLTVGAVLELYLLVAFPTGGARFPEGATATVVAVATATYVAVPGSLPLGIGVGLLWGQVGGMTITVQRKINGRLVPEPSDEVMAPGRLVRVHLGAVVMDFLRGCSVTLTGVLVGRLVATVAAATWPLASDDSLGLLLVGGAVSAGILLRSLGGFRSRRFLFVAGVAAGILGAKLL